MNINLLDMQKEIRNLESKIQDIYSHVSSIYKKIDESRNKDIIKESLDYEMIRIVSARFSFEEHPLSKLKNVYARQMYIEILLSLIQLDKESKVTMNRLIFIQWIINESRLKIKLEDIFRETLKMSSSTFGKFINILPEQYNDYLIVDALIIANICGDANKDILSYIANICVILGINKEKIRILSITTKCILKQSIGKMKKEDLKFFLTYLKKFKYYIDSNMNNEIMEKTLLLQRKIVAKVPDSKSVNFKWKVKQKSEVEKGDLIATYNRNSSYSRSVVKITAPYSGTIFQFRDKCINYGVISYNIDNKDSIKEWVLQQKK